MGAKGRQQWEEGSGLLKGQGLMLDHSLDNFQAGRLSGFIPIIMRNICMIHMYLQLCRNGSNDASQYFSGSALIRTIINKVVGNFMQ